MLAFAPEPIRENLLYGCCYPQAIALGCAGLLVLFRGGDRPRLWRYLVAGGLFVLAHWVYVAVSILLILPCCSASRSWLVASVSWLRSDAASARALSRWPLASIVSPNQPNRSRKKSRALEARLELARGRPRRSVGVTRSYWLVVLLHAL